MTEYWLQKKTLGGWSTVTWYEGLEQARKNYINCAKPDSGYSWRLVEVNVIEQVLNDPTEVKAPDPEPLKSGWGEPVQIKGNGWDATPTPSGWGNLTSDNPSPVATPSNQDPSSPSTHSFYDDGKSEHGLTGSVWLVHHGLRKKTRASADQVESLMQQGYVKGGPNTRFE